MDKYSFLNIPNSCFIGSTIYKKLFYENANLSTTDKTLFTDTIDKINWVYCLKPETINISDFKDEERDYPEIEVIEVILRKNNKINRIAEIIMRTIPYPMLLIFKLEDKLQFYVAHQRINQNDKSKNRLEEIITTEWLENDSSLFAKLNIKTMRFINLYSLYSDIVDIISLYKVSNIIGENAPISGAEARTLFTQIEEIDKQINGLRAKLKKESQFNRKIELNIEIKKLRNLKNELLGGVKECKK